MNVPTRMASRCFLIVRPRKSSGIRVTGRGYVPIVIWPSVPWHAKYIRHVAFHSITEDNFQFFFIYSSNDFFPLAIPIYE